MCFNVNHAQCVKHVTKLMANMKSAKGVRQNANNGTQYVDNPNAHEMSTMAQSHIIESTCRLPLQLSAFFPKASTVTGVTLILQAIVSPSPSLSNHHFNDSVKASSVNASSVKASVKALASVKASGDAMTHPGSDHAR